MHARVGSRSLLAVGAVALALGACNRGGDSNDQRTGSVTRTEVRASRQGWPAAVSAHLDSGNRAFSAKNMQEALRHYQAMLAEESPKNAQVTAYFGLYMTHSALGDTVAAKAASAKLQELEPDASLLGHGNPMVGDTTRPAPLTPDDSIHRGRRQ